MLRIPRDSAESSRYSVYSTEQPRMTAGSLGLEPGKSGFEFWSCHSQVL